MNFNQYTIKAQETIQQAVMIAQGNQQQVVETGHLLKALLEEDENTSSFLLKKLNINQNLLFTKLESIVSGYPKVSGNTQPYLGNDLSNAFNKSMGYLKEFQDDFVSIELLYLGILAGKDSTANLMREVGFREKETKEIQEDRNKD